LIQLKGVDASTSFIARQSPHTPAGLDTDFLQGYSHWIRAVAASPPIPASVGAEPQATGTKAAGPATERLKGLDLRHGLGLSIASSVEGATFSAGGKRALVDFILQRGFEARAAPALDERHWGG